MRGGREKKGGERERNRGGTRDAFKLVSTSVHPPLPAPLSPRCFLHREAEKEEFVFFLRHTKSRVYVKERAADYLSFFLPFFFLFFLFSFSTAWRVTVATPATILSTRFCPPFRGAPSLTRPLFFRKGPIWLVVGISPMYR